jgi:hypothetical protein
VNKIDKQDYRRKEERKFDKKLYTNNNFNSIGEMDLGKVAFRYI